MNTIIFEISFITSGIPFGILKLIGVRTPWVGAIIAFGYVMFLWKALEAGIMRNIDFKACEQYYLSVGRVFRILSLITIFLLLFISFLFMIFSISMFFS